MALLIKPLRCPHCQEPMDKRLLRLHGKLKAFLNRKPFACPHCQQGVIFPEKADNLVSMGLFVAVILAPLFHFWQVDPIDPKHVFVIGTAVTLIGLFTQKLQKSSLPAE